MKILNFLDTLRGGWGGYTAVKYTTKLIPLRDLFQFLRTFFPSLKLQNEEEDNLVAADVQTAWGSPPGGVDGVTNT